MYNDPVLVSMENDDITRIRFLSLLSSRQHVARTGVLRGSGVNFLVQHIDSSNTQPSSQEQSSIGPQLPLCWPQQWQTQHNYEHTSVETKCLPRGHHTMAASVKRFLCPFSHSLEFNWILPRLPAALCVDSVTYLVKTCTCWLCLVEKRKPECREKAHLPSTPGSISQKLNLECQSRSLSRCTVTQF